MGLFPELHTESLWPGATLALSLRWPCWPPGFALMCELPITKPGDSARGLAEVPQARSSACQEISTGVKWLNTRVRVQGRGLHWLDIPTKLRQGVSMYKPHTKPRAAGRATISSSKTLCDLHYLPGKDKHCLGKGSTVFCPQIPFVSSSICVLQKWRDGNWHTSWAARSDFPRFPQEFQHSLMPEER